MDTHRILADLRAEVSRIDKAIAALEALGSIGDSIVPAATSSAAPRKARRRGRMSAAGRKRLSEMMKKRWAARKKPSTRHMSAATRKRLSELAKKRWAERKKQAV